MGRIARRVYLTVVLLLIITSATFRVYTYVLAHRMEAVITGLRKLEVDRSSEEEVVRIVPHLSRRPWGGEIKRTAETGEIDIGTARYYSVKITNERSEMEFGRLIRPFASCCARTQYTKDGYERNWIMTRANLMAKHGRREPPIPDNW